MSLSDQAFGHDARDGTPAGRQIVAPAIGDLAMIQWKYTDIGVSAAGSSAAFFNDGQTPLNDDRGGRNLQIAVPVDGAAGGTQGLSVSFTFWGRVFGLRYIRNYAAPGQDFSLFIDAKAHLLLHAYYQQDNMQPVNPSHDNICNAIIDQYLPEGQHLAELWFPAGTFGTAAYQLLGYLAERRIGHQEQTPTGMINSFALSALVGSPQVIMSNAGPHTLESLRFRNPTGGTINITILSNGQIMDILAITAGQAVLWPIGAKVSPNILASGVNSLTAYCDVPGVICFPIGEY